MTSVARVVTAIFVTLLAIGLLIRLWPLVPVLIVGVLLYRVLRKRYQRIIPGTKEYRAALAARADAQHANNDIYGQYPPVSLQMCTDESTDAQQNHDMGSGVVLNNKQSYAQLEYYDKSNAQLKREYFDTKAIKES
jgi:hypothetical protein